MFIKKKGQIVYLTFFILGSLLAILYSSCQKDPCSGVTCLNGGTCNNGSCQCVIGYSGQRCETLKNTTVVYQNNTYTPINLTVNGTSTIIPIGGSLSFSGVPGDSIRGTGYTCGVSNTGTQVGQMINWDLSCVYPSATSSPQIFPLDVISLIFFLKISNNDAYYSATGVYINYGSSFQTFDAVNVPNNGATYNIGYYSAYTFTQGYVTGTGGATWGPSSIYLNFLYNQSFTINLN